METNDINCIFVPVSVPKLFFNNFSHFVLAFFQGFAEIDISSLQVSTTSNLNTAHYYFIIYAYGV